MNLMRNQFVRHALLLLAVSAVLVIVACEHGRTWRHSHAWPRQFVIEMSDPVKADAELNRRMAAAAPKAQTMEDAHAKSVGCISCHGQTDEPDMHIGRTLAIGCVDCHGGDATVMSPGSSPGRPGALGTPITDRDYLKAMAQAHVPPRNPEAWYGRHHLQDGKSFGAHVHEDPTKLHGSATPPGSFALLNHESPEFIRFINPGDLRVAEFACGACHPGEVAANGHSMMAHGAQLWGAALYNNGSIPNKIPRYGESYSPFGIPQRLQGVIDVSKATWNKDTQRVEAPLRWPTPEETWTKGLVPFLDPLPLWNVSQPGNVLRVFERGTKLPIPGGPIGNPNPIEIGNPNPLVEGGRPDKGLSPRGLGTINRTDPVFIGLQKTRLLDPILYFAGTNDHPGDYRHSGCTACHTPYANDRDPYHAAQWAEYGNLGTFHGIDPTIPRDEPGHPIKHVFTNAMPSSQCIVCHIHPGTSYANTYLGYMWWDNESDGQHMYPEKSKNPTPAERWRSLRKNPEGAHLKGHWGDVDFLAMTGKPRSSLRDPLKKEDAKPQATPGNEESVFNDQLQHNQFADFHGHGWMFRAVHKKDRTGNLLDVNGHVIDPEDPDKWAKAVHLRDIHAERGMHCVDCHFSQDGHGDGKLYGEVRSAIAITCTDCHGGYGEIASLKTSGPASQGGGIDLSRLTIGPRRLKRFWKEGGLVYQRSALNPDKVWTVTQTAHTIDPGSQWSKDNPDAAKLSRYAKTVRADGRTWGDLPKDAGQSSLLAHGESDMACYTCHTSWMTSCFGCHLPMTANERTPMLHNESIYTRNWTQYNFQVLRDEVFMIGRDAPIASQSGLDADGNLKPGKIVPVRSSSAVLVSSQNQNREWVYHQQQTVSGEGYSGQAFNPHFPHATSGPGTTRTCTDCHVAKDNSNNAWMAQLLLQGTNFVNFLGRYAYVATGGAGLEAVIVTEHDEPQAVYGSHLHKLAYPDEYAAFERKGRDLALPPLEQNSLHHAAPWGGAILDLQVRGEYLYTARGRAGFYAYDVANIDNKGFSERIVTAPVSNLGQRLGFKTRNAVAVASPSTLALDPARLRLSNDASKPAATIMDPLQPWHVNQEQAMHPMYAYIYIGDSEEGLVMTFAGTLLDGDPDNNFLKRAELADGTTAFNPVIFEAYENDSTTGIMRKLNVGLSDVEIAGHFAYITSDAGLTIVDIDTPLSPRIAANIPGTQITATTPPNTELFGPLQMTESNEGPPVTVAGGYLLSPRAVAIQFRYAFVTDADGMKVVDITVPEKARLVPDAVVPLRNAQRIYLARTYAFVAAGEEGLAIIDITNPEKPVLQMTYDAGGKLNDVRDVKVGMTNASLFAYVANGKHGLAVLELMGPHSTPQFRGFAPPLSPQLIATYHTHGPALAISKGLDRDRAVDETGNQLAVFGRWGARPLNLAEMRRMYLRAGRLWTVTDEPTTDPADFTYERPDAAPKPATPTPPPAGPPRGGPPRGGGPPR